MTMNSTSLSEEKPIVTGNSVTSRISNLIQEAEAKTKNGRPPILTAAASSDEFRKRKDSVENNLNVSKANNKSQRQSPLGRENSDLMAGSDAPKLPPKPGRLFDFKKSSITLALSSTYRVLKNSIFLFVPYLHPSVPKVRCLKAKSG